MPTTKQKDYDGPDRRLPTEPPGWHLDKKVPLSLIFAMLVQVGYVVWAVADLKKDVELGKMQNLEQRERDRRQDDQVTQSISLVRSDLSVIRGQLDRLLEERRRP